MKWISAWASVIGSSHVEEGTPCQDNSLITTIPDTTWIIAALSDGAGSSEHSQIGSEKAVHLAIQKYSEVVKLNGWSDNSTSLNAESWQQESFTIFKQIREELSHLSEERQIDLKTLACTLIVAVSSGTFMACAHIGDGRGAFVNAEGEWTPLLKPYKGEEANQTVFLTTDVWEHDIETEYFETQFHQSNVFAFTIMSDGCERAAFEVLRNVDGSTDQLYDPNKPFRPFFENNINVLRQLTEKGVEQEQINKLWSKFLREGNPKLRTETDDKSLVLSIFHPETDVKENKALK